MEHRAVKTCTGGRSQLFLFREDEIFWGTSRRESLAEVILTFLGIVYGDVENRCKQMNWLGKGATKRVRVFTPLSAFLFFCFSFSVFSTPPRGTENLHKYSSIHYSSMSAFCIFLGPTIYRKDRFSPKPTKSKP